MKNSYCFCAHRGLSKLVPENSLPAFAAAYALGADEIEFDIRLTKDAQLVVSHDDTLERISNGTGKVCEHTLSELKTLNIGVKDGWVVPLCTPEEIFDLFAGRMRFNIHLKEHGEEGYLIRELIKIASKYSSENRIYFAGSPSELEWMQRVAPNISRTAIQLPSDKIEIFEIAKTYHCSRVQFWLDMFDCPLINKLHENHISCNLYYADCAENYKKYFDMGIDTILTNRMDLAADFQNSAAVFLPR